MAMTTDRPAATIDGEIDGRRLRREQNRDAVLDALLELFAEGNYEPGANDIAERAGISPRSLFRYFEDRDDLQRAATNRQVRRAFALVEVDLPPDAPTAAKIDAIANARSRMFEEIGPAARAIRVCAHRHPPLAEELRGGRAFLRNQLRRLFAPELAAAGEHVLPAMDVLCSFESYDLMRADNGLSRAKAVSTLVNALTALLDAKGDRR